MSKRKKPTKMLNWGQTQEIRETISSGQYYWLVNHAIGGGLLSHTRPTRTVPYGFGAVRQKPFASFLAQCAKTIRSGVERGELQRGGDRYFSQVGRLRKVTVAVFISKLQSSSLQNSSLLCCITFDIMSKNIVVFDSPAKALKGAPSIALASALQSFESEYPEVYREFISKIKHIPAKKAAKAEKQDLSKIKRQAAAAAAARIAAKDAVFQNLREKIVAVSESTLTVGVVARIVFSEGAPFFCFHYVCRNNTLRRGHQGRSL